jgi:hypothetical protein
MADFDPMRAQLTLVSAAREMHDFFETQAKGAEQKLAEAETARNATLRMRAYALERLNEEKAKLKVLEDAAAQGG